MQVLKESPEAEKYKQISEFCFNKMDFPSIVNSSILSAVDGKFGNYHVTDRYQSIRHNFGPNTNQRNYDRNNLFSKFGYFLFVLVINNSRLRI
jgi:hypothetical protein